MVGLDQKTNPYKSPKILATFESSTMKCNWYEDGVMNTIFKENKLVTMEDVTEVLTWVESLGERKYLNLFEGGHNTDFDAEVRRYAASKEENKFTIADAFVVKSIAHQLVGNFYIQFNRPYKPTRLFKNRESALIWLKTFEDQYMP